MTTRTIEVVEAEIAALRAKGYDNRHGEVKALKAELAVLLAEGSPKQATAPAAPPVAFGAVDVTPAPVDDAEWRFIEKCLAEVQIEFGSGHTARAASTIYEALDMRVRIWRVLRRLVSANGVGAEWPAWSTFNLDDSSGRPRKPKPVAPPPEPAPVVFPGQSLAPPVMPPMMQQGARPPAAAVLAHVTGGMHPGAMVPPADPAAQPSVVRTAAVVG